MSKSKLNLEEKKYKNPYKTVSLGNSTKDVDMTKRVVTGMFNSYFYIDSDLDMLLPGAASKSIKERGPGTNKGNKIKHLKQHDWNQVTARIDVLQEKKVSFNGNVIEGIYHESYYPDTPESNSMLVGVQEKLYDARSIGYRYINLTLADPNSEQELYQNNWNKYLPMALNPEVAEEAGYFYIVKEIMLKEGSDVAMGANELTPFLGLKSYNKTDFFDKLIEKMGIIEGIFSKGSLTDTEFYTLENQYLQIKQELINFSNKAPSIKDTLNNSRQKGTIKKNNALDFFNNLK